MRLAINRIKSSANATLGCMWLNGVFQCFTLEDEYREEKVSAETRIPAGTYRVTLRHEGGMIERYKKRFPWHGGMLWLRDVPGFEYIYIHIGNTDADTAGCILVGAGCDSIRLTLQASAAAYEDLYERVSRAAHEDNLTITIFDSDRSHPDAHNTAP